MLLDDRSTATVTLCQTNVKMINVFWHFARRMQETQEKSQDNSQPKI
jgi:hypothetical protein